MYKPTSTRPQIFPLDVFPEDVYFFGGYWYALSRYLHFAWWTAKGYQNVCVRP